MVPILEDHRPLYDRYMPIPTRDRFCPVCGGPLSWRRVNAHDPERQVCERCGHVHYHNSKPCTEIVIVQNGRVLFLRRAHEPRKGYWDLPGGFMEPFEHPEDGARREAREETGLEVGLDGLLGAYLDTYDDPQGGYAVVVLSYLAHVIGGALQPAPDEVDQVAWLAPEEFPAEPAFPHMHQTFEDLRHRLTT
jgi:ADP-ribose pyrophosphatase YjhB (NUDIX family)